MPQQSKAAPNSIFSLLYLDPFAGLDPTAAAIEETRALARHHADRAQSALAALPALEIRDALSAVAEFCVARAY